MSGIKEICFAAFASFCAGEGVADASTPAVPDVWATDMHALEARRPPREHYLEVTIRATDNGSMKPQVLAGPVGAHVAIWICQRTAGECHELWSDSNLLFASRTVTIREIVKLDGNEPATIIFGVKGLVAFQRNLKILKIALQLAKAVLGATPAAPLSVALNEAANLTTTTAAKENEKKKAIDADLEFKLVDGARVAQCLRRDRFELELGKSGTEPCDGLEILFSAETKTEVVLNPQPPEPTTCTFDISGYTAAVERERSALTTRQRAEEDALLGALRATQVLCNSNDTNVEADHYLVYKQAVAGVPFRYHHIHKSLETLISQEITAELRDAVHVAIKPASTAAQLQEAAMWLGEYANLSMPYKECIRRKAMIEYKHIEALKMPTKIEECDRYLADAAMNSKCPTCIAMVSREKEKLKLINDREMLMSDAVKILKLIHQGTEAETTDLNRYANSCRPLDEQEENLPSELEELRKKTLDALSQSEASSKVKAASEYLMESNKLAAKVRKVLEQSCAPTAAELVVQHEQSVEESAKIVIEQLGH